VRPGPERSNAKSDAVPGVRRHIASVGAGDADAVGGIYEQVRVVIVSRDWSAGMGRYVPLEPEG